MAIVVPIVTQYNGKGLRQATTEISKAEGAFGKLGAAGKIAAGSLVAVGGALAVGAGSFVWQSLRAYSDLNETLNKSKVIFGDAASAIEQFGSNANQSLGQTKQQAIDAAANFGVFGQAAGLSGQELATFSTSLVSLSADLASFSNTSPEEAITALGAALRGESEPIRRYGVLLDDATLKAKAMEMNIYSGTGALSQQQRVMAAYQVILSQTKNQQGDFARTSDGLANQMRILEATVQDLQVAFGEALTTGMGGADNTAKDLNSSLGSLEPLVRLLGKRLGEASSAGLEFAGVTADVASSTQNAGDEANVFTKALNYMVNDFPLAWNGLRTMGDLMARLRGETEAAGDAAITTAQDYVASAQVVAGAANKLGQASTYSGGTPTSGYSTEWTTQKVLGLRKAAAEAEKAAAALRKTGSGGSSAAAGLTAAEKAAKAAGEKFDAMKAKVEKNVTTLENMSRALDEAKQKLADYAQAKSDWITGSVDLGAAIQQQLDYVAKAADFDKRIADAIAAGDSEGAAKAAAEKAGMGAAVSWTDAFLGQIKQAKGAAQAVDQLLATLNPADTVGNQRLLDALTTLSPEQAQLAASDLVKNGLGPSIAAELSSLDVWANGTALTWAQTFYQPGVDAATTAYDAIRTTLEKQLPGLYALGRKAGKSFMDGYNSVVNGLPKDVRVPNAPQLVGASNGQAPIVVNVTAGIGNPVAIAQEVQRVLSSSSARLGV